MSELTFEVPDEKTPGYLRRIMAAGRFSEMMRAGDTGTEFYESLITFLLGFIVEPKDRDEAHEALLDATQEQYMELLDAINGAKRDPTPAQPKETS
jgi:hypothetical protein